MHKLLSSKRQPSTPVQPLAIFWRLMTGINNQHTSIFGWAPNKMLKGHLVYQKVYTLLIMLDLPHSQDPVSEPALPVHQSATTLTKRCTLLVSIPKTEVPCLFVPHWLKLCAWSRDSHWRPACYAHHSSLNQWQWWSSRSFHLCIRALVSMEPPEWPLHPILSHLITTIHFFVPTAWCEPLCMKPPWNGPTFIGLYGAINLSIHWSYTFSRSWLATASHMIGSLSVRSIKVAKTWQDPKYNVEAALLLAWEHPVRSAP